MVGAALEGLVNSNPFSDGLHTDSFCIQDDFTGNRAIDMADIVYVDYKDESMLPDIQRLVARDLSEPYSVYTYRYFLHNCPRFCICAYDQDKVDATKSAMIATIVCKLEGEGEAMQGYMAMLAVDKNYRKQGIARKLVTMVIDRMVADGCREVMLETEVRIPYLEHRLEQYSIVTFDVLCVFDCRPQTWVRSPCIQDSVS
jgi:peptide alpha-N-acetyltransferase